MKAKCKNYGMEWAYLDESMVEYSDMGEEICPQCKTMHPPLRPGEKCPNSGIGEMGNKIGIDDVIINKHLVEMKNIIISNMYSKNIKDGKKFFQYAIIELTKSLELYNE